MTEGVAMARKDDRALKYRWLDAVSSPAGPESATMRHCLLALARYMDHAGHDAFPSIERLAEDTALGEATVKRHLRDAEALGWLRRSPYGGGGQGWRRYRYLPTTPKVGSERPHVTGKVGSLTTEGGITDDRRWDHSDPLLLQGDSRETPEKEIPSSIEDGPAADVDNSMGETFAPIIRRRWWQAKRPPPTAPKGWDMARDLTILRQWEAAGYSRAELVAALELYEGSPATLALTHKRGNRHILNDLLEEVRKRSAPPAPARQSRPESTDPERISVDLSKILPTPPEAPS
jgi:hypothetical protein